MGNIYWIVAWTVIKTVPIPCPDAVERAKKDAEYGLAGIYGMSTCAVFHARTETNQYFKTFESSASAKEFTDGMPPEIKWEVTESTTPKNVLPGLFQ